MPSPGLKPISKFKNKENSKDDIRLNIKSDNYTAMIENDNNDSIYENNQLESQNLNNRYNRLIIEETIPTPLTNYTTKSINPSVPSEHSNLLSEDWIATQLENELNEDDFKHHFMGSIWDRNDEDDGDDGDDISFENNEHKDIFNSKRDNLFNFEESPNNFKSLDRSISNNINANARSISTIHITDATTSKINAVVDQDNSLINNIIDNNLLKHEEMGYLRDNQINMNQIQTDNNIINFEESPNNFKSLDRSISNNINANARSISTIHITDATTSRINAVVDEDNSAINNIIDNKVLKHEVAYLKDTQIHMNQIQSKISIGIGKKGHGRIGDKELPLRKNEISIGISTNNTYSGLIFTLIERIL